MNRSHRVLGTLAALFLAFPSNAQDSITVIPGNVTVAAIFSVNDPENGACGKYDVEILQNIVAVTWFLEAVNQMNYVPGVTIGLDVYRTCKIQEKATEGVIKLLDDYNLISDRPEENGLLLGILGPDRTSEALSVSRLLSSLPVSQRLVQISGSATGKQLSNQAQYPSFFRVVPPDDKQVKVMSELMVQMQWNYIAIVFDDDDYGRSAATELRQIAEARHICVPVFASLPLDTTSFAFTSKVNSIAQELQSKENGPVRGMVILGGISSTQRMVETLSLRVSYVNLIVSEAIALQRDSLLANGQVTALAAGTLVTSPPVVLIPELVTVWNNLWLNKTVFQENVVKIPWLADYLNAKTGCDVNTAGCWDQAAGIRNSHLVSQARDLSMYSGYQIKATALMAALLKRIYNSACGPSHSGLCQPLSQQLAYRQDTIQTLRQSSFDLTDFSGASAAFADMPSVTFNDTNNIHLEDRTSDEYTVFNFRQGEQGDYSFVKIGSWVDEALTINTSLAEFYDSLGKQSWSELPPAQCGVNQDCLQCIHDVSKDVIFVEGDLYIIGILPVSTKIQGNPLECGAVKPLAGADIAQSLVFAVESVNKKTGIFKNILPGKRVGLLLINTCGSEPLTRQHLLQLHAGTLPLNDTLMSAAILDNIMGYVGAYFSANSIAVSETLQTLPRPFVQISAASTSPLLSDTTKHPYFLRLPVPDDRQAEVMLDLVHTVGANYIQIIYDGSTTYTTGLYHALRDKVADIKRYNICIAQSIMTTPREDVSQYFWIKNKLRAKPAAKTVIIILHPVEIDMVMNALLPHLQAEEFLFLGSESWGRRAQLIEGRTKLAGSLIMAQETVIDQIFERYFQDLDPLNSANPWLTDFWESRLHCYFRTSYRRKDKSDPCPTHPATGYGQDFRIPVHINAVYALALGFHAAFSRVCGLQAVSICKELTSADLLSEMMKVRLDMYGTGQPSKLFDSNGDGLVGYKILQISRDLTTPEDDVILKDVGFWSLNKLTLNLEGMPLFGRPSFQSVCPNDLECKSCFPQPPIISNNTHRQLSDSSTVSMAAFISVVVLLIIVLAVGVALFILLLLHRRRTAMEKAQSSSSSQAPSFDAVTFRAARSDEFGSDYSYIDQTQRAGEVQPSVPPRPCSSKPDSDYLHPVAT